ncbi:MAG: hypothetical protein U0694_06300 [Anaerolineae bacterium]
MPVRKFPLDGGKNLEIEWRGLWRDVVVKVDGESIGTVATQKEMKTGRSFTLKDGGKLDIKLEQHRDDSYTLRVTKDGKELTSEKESQGIGWLLALIVLLVGLGGTGGGVLTQLGQLNPLPDVAWEGLALMGGGTTFFSIVSFVSLVFSMGRKRS